MDKFFFRKSELGILDENNVWNLFNLRFTVDHKFHIIYVKNICVIYVGKYHDHRYDIQCFFYKNLYIYHRERIESKKELYSAIQKLLEENL